ncbi:MAG TPA: polysaccharide biosynthesis tyrosine autokinase [Chloroflexota bacterium]|nr:polysaccharide biosynthesis tyrosine autokinase [Chloroflexota bacterium]
MNTLSTNHQANIYLAVLKRWWWLPVAFALFSGILTYAGTTLLMKPEYGASITILVQPLSVGGGQVQILDANTVATLLTSNTVQAQAFRQLSGSGRQDPKALFRTTCTADTNDRFVTCSTTSRNYRAAASVLNTLGAAFRAYDRDQIAGYFRAQLAGYQHQINQVRYQLSLINRQLRNAPQGSGIQSALIIERSGLESNLTSFQNSMLGVANQITDIAGRVALVSAAQAKPHQVSPHPFRNALLGMIVGIGIAAALVVLLEFIDDTFRSSEEISEATGLSILGAVRRFEGPPEEMGLIAWTKPRSPMSEAYRVARANIQFTNLSGNLSTLMVTSARDGEGKTTTANNIAATFALAGRRVLLIDADLRRPGLTKIFRLKDSPGLSTALIEPGTRPIRHTEVPGLDVVPSGPLPPNPSELLGSDQMRDFIAECVSRYDLVVLDTPPILSVADTRILATLTSAVVMVVDPSLSTRRMVRQARLALDAVGARVLGVILNRDAMRGEGYYYNYYYYDRLTPQEDQELETAAER